jgi:Eukaryotic translation initiation factor 3 subunit 7 (eIF-3)
MSGRHVLPVDTDGQSLSTHRAGERRSSHRRPCKLRPLGFRVSWSPKPVPLPRAGVDWRQKIENQRGAVLATELKNNANKLAKWTAGALVSGAELIKLGYVSRVHWRDPYNHVILSTQVRPALDPIGHRRPVFATDCVGSYLATMSRDPHFSDASVLNAACVWTGCVGEVLQCKPVALRGVRGVPLEMNTMHLVLAGMQSRTFRACLAACGPRPQLEMNGIRLVLYGMQNRTFHACLAACERLVSLGAAS